MQLIVAGQSARTTDTFRNLSSDRLLTPCAEQYLPRCGSGGPAAQLRPTARQFRLGYTPHGRRGGSPVALVRTIAPERPPTASQALSSQQQRAGLAGSVGFGSSLLPFSTRRDTCSRPGRCWRSPPAAVLYLLKSPSMVVCTSRQVSGRSAVVSLKQALAVVMLTAPSRPSPG